MSNYRVGESADLYDPTTGAWVGVLDRNGKEQEVATPAAVAASLGGHMDTNNNPVFIVIPRTGQLDNLLALDGNAGENASAIDAPATVKFTGAVGAAVAFMPFGATYQYNVTGDAAITIKPFWMRFVVYANSGAVRTLTGTIGDGYYVGQRMWVLIDAPDQTLGVTISVDGSAQLLVAGNEYELRWTGSVWAVVFVRGNVGDGGGNPVYARAQAVQGGQALDSDAYAVGPGAQAAVAFSWVESLTRQVASRNNGERMMAYGGKSTTVLTDLFASTAGTTLTTLVSRDTTNYLFQLESGAARVRAVITGRISGTNVWQGVREFLVTTNSSGVPSLIGTPQTIGTDIQNGTLTAPTAVTISVIASQLNISVTPAVATGTNWVAHLEIVKVQL